MQFNFLFCHSLMFWSDWGVSPRIERSALDGSQRRAIISEGVVWPNGLVIDASAKRIYWADAKLDRIESAGLAGEERSQLVTSLPHPFGLALVSTRALLLQRCTVFLVKWGYFGVESFV